MKHESVLSVLLSDALRNTRSRSLVFFYNQPNRKLLQSKLKLMRKQVILLKLKEAYQSEYNCVRQLGMVRHVTHFYLAYQDHAVKLQGIQTYIKSRSPYVSQSAQNLFTGQTTVRDERLTVPAATHQHPSQLLFG